MAPKLTSVDWRTFEKIILAAGFRFRRQQGSHRCYTKPGVHRPVVIPTYSELSPDIITSNLRTAGISKDEYLSMLKEL